MLTWKYKMICRSVNLMLGWSKNYDIIEANLCILAVLIKNILKVIKKVLKSHPIHSIFRYSSWGGSRNPHFFPSSLLKNHPSCIVCIHILNVSSKKKLKLTTITAAGCVCVYYSKKKQNNSTQKCNSIIWTHSSRADENSANRKNLAGELYNGC